MQIAKIFDFVQVAYVASRKASLVFSVLIETFIITKKQGSFYRKFKLIEYLSLLTEIILINILRRNGKCLILNVLG